MCIRDSPNTVFEIYNYRTGKLVDTIKTDKNGVAVSKPVSYTHLKHWAWMKYGAPTIPGL